MGFSIINHPCWVIPIAGNPHGALSRTKLQKVSHSRNGIYWQIDKWWTVILVFRLFPRLLKTHTHTLFPAGVIPVATGFISLNNQSTPIFDCSNPPEKNSECAIFFQLGIYLTRSIRDDHMIIPRSWIRSYPLVIYSSLLWTIPNPIKMVMTGGWFMALFYTHYPLVN